SQLIQRLDDRSAWALTSHPRPRYVLTKQLVLEANAPGGEPRGRRPETPAPLRTRSCLQTRRAAGVGQPKGNALVEITNSFSVPLPPDDAWRGLLEVPRIAPCMPGARLKERLEEGRYKGGVAVRLGPVMLNFAGKAEIVEQDPAARKARVRAEGSDAKGRGGAQADVHFALEPDGAATRVTILTNLTLTGSVAQYGRGAGMINDLASHMVGQFAANLRRELERSE